MVNLEKRIESGSKKARQMLDDLDFIESTTRWFSSGNHPSIALVELYDALSQGLGAGYAIEEDPQEMIAEDISTQKHEIAAHLAARKIVETLKERNQNNIEAYRHNGVLKKPCIETIITDFVKQYHRLARKRILKDDTQVLRFAQEYFLGIEEQLEAKVGEYSLKQAVSQEVFINDRNTTTSKNRIVPNKNFDDVIGLDELKEIIRRKVITPIIEQERWAAIKKQPEKIEDQQNFLFLGEPGTGKTYFAMCLAGEAQIPFYAVSGSDFVQPLHGGGKNMLSELYKSAQQNSKAIIFIDEADCLFLKRESRSAELKIDVITEFLTILDGIKSKGTVSTILSSNMKPDHIDRAVLSRIPTSNRYHFPRLSKDMLSKIMMYQMSLYHHDDISDHQIKQLEDQLSGRNPRYIKQAIQDAATRAVYQGRNRISFQDLEASIGDFQNFSEN